MLVVADSKNYVCWSTAAKGSRRSPTIHLHLSRLRDLVYSDLSCLRTRYFAFYRRGRIRSLPDCPTAYYYLLTETMKSNRKYSCAVNVGARRGDPGAQVVTLCFSYGLNAALKSTIPIITIKKFNNKNFPTPGIEPVSYESPVHRLNR